MSELQQDFGSALRKHLAEQNEGSLIQAYELGRRALALGLGLLDLLALYESAYRELVLGAPAEEQARAAAAVASFFREFASAFEMGLRGYQETNRELQRANANLSSAYLELQAKQVQLVQSAKMASLGELVAGIAHEINNPLSFVVSHMSTVRSTLERIETAIAAEPASAPSAQWNRVRERLREGELGLDRIRQLVLKLRTFSRLDEGERKSVSMRDSIGSVLTILEHRVKGRIEVRTEFGEPDLVECFPGQLNQAVMNLVANAIDAISAEGTITIRTGQIGPEYLITVIDTGHGIPDELRQRVLEPFFTTKPVGKGTGLGLSISDSIVRQHQGTLELSPAEGGGTIATIRFPIVNRA